MSLENKPSNENYLKKLTQSHYDSRPLDLDTDSRFKSFREERYVGKIFSERKIRGRVIDVGCGAGVLSSYIKKQYGVKKIYAGDLSLESLKKAKERGLIAINLDNLFLPFKSSTAEVVISGGVIHHTPAPRKAFSELARITKKGGEMWLAVYNKNHLYFYLYNYVGGLFRNLKENFLERFITNYIAFSLYYCSYYILQIIVRKNLNPMPHAQAVNMFHDTFLTPVASFHTFGEIESWAKEQGFHTVSKRTEVAGQMLSFRFKKI